MSSDFLSSIFTWEALFSNIIWSLLISAGLKGVLWLVKKPISNRLYWVIVPVFVLILLSAANYITGGRSRLNEPHLSGSIDGINIAPVPNSTNSSLLLIVTLYNSGAPSFADKYRLSVKVAGAAKEVVGAPQVLPQSMTLVNDDGSRATYYGEDALY